MKGLLLQDYYLSKKNLLVSLFISLFFIITTILLNIDLQTSEVASSVDASLLLLALMLPIFFCSCVYFTLGDENHSYYYLYINSCPITNNLFVFTKYIFVYATLAITVIVLAIYALILHILNGYTFSFDMFAILFIIISLHIIVHNIELPLALRFGTAISSAILIAFVFIFSVSLLILVIKSAETSGETSLTALYNKHQIPILIGILFVDILSFKISYKISSKINRVG